MSNEDYEQTPGAFESASKDFEPDPSSEVFIERYTRRYKGTFTCCRKILAYMVAIPLLAIGLFFMLFRHGGGTVRLRPMSQHWPKLAYLKERLQGLLRDIQRKSEPNPNIR
jgi:hypothetical protein